MREIKIRPKFFKYSSNIKMYLLRGKKKTLRSRFLVLMNVFLFKNVSSFTILNLVIYFETEFKIINNFKN